MKRLNELLVVIPQSGIIVPGEISQDILSDRFFEIAGKVDWYTNWLYDFRDLLYNRHLAFSYSNLLLNTCAHSDLLDKIIPLAGPSGEEMYKKQMEPSLDLRKHLLEKYVLGFHKEIDDSILAGAEFIICGRAFKSKENRIDLINFQKSPKDQEEKQYCPDIMIETYAQKLQTRLPDVRVKVNPSDRAINYSHICADHAVNALTRVGKYVPAICQETSQGLYKNKDGSPDIRQLNRLRRIFAESIYSTLEEIRMMSRLSNKIDLHNMRQTYDYDCGPQALQTLMAYYGVTVREDILIKKLKADEEGTGVGEMVAYAKKNGFEVIAGENWTFDDLKHYIDQGHPVIVLLQAWSEKMLAVKDWRKHYEDGHFAIVVGYNEKAVFFEDPSSFHKTWLKHNEFHARWHDIDSKTHKKLEHFGMVLLGRKPVGEVLEHME